VSFSYEFEKRVEEDLLTLERCRVEIELLSLDLRVDLLDERVME